MLNRLTPAKVLAAASLIKQGKIYDMGRVFEEDMPLFDLTPQFAPNHQKFLVENGIYIMENIDFSALLQDEVYEFAFVFGAIRFKGATGSPARPFAIR